MTEPRRKNDVKPGQFWLTKENDIVHIVRRHVVAIEDSWIANIAKNDGTFQGGAEIYGYDLNTEISRRDAQKRLKDAQEAHAERERCLIEIFLK